MDPWFLFVLGVVVGVLGASLAVSYRRRSSRAETDDVKPEEAPVLGKGVEHLAAGLDAVASSRALNAERFYERRRVEWRLTFTLWGGLVLLANAITGIEGLSKTDTRWVLLAVVAAVLLHLGWEYFFVVRAAEANRLQGYYLENVLRRTIGIDDVPHRDYLAGWAHYWQVLVTLLLGLGLYLVAWLSAA